MKLENHILNSIKNFPTLFRGDTYEESRIPVLGHIFLSYGTGLEWSPEGFLAELKPGRKAVGYIEIKAKPRLPKDYFQKTLWDSDIPVANINAAKAELGTRYFYTRKDRYERRTINLVFEGEEAFAQEFVDKYGDKEKYNGRVYLHGAESAYRIGKAIQKDPNAHVMMKRFYGACLEYTPCSMCEYSPIVEMIKGRTNSPHIDNFDLVNIQPDYIAGAIEISKYSIGFYEDDERCKSDHYHPERSGADTRKRFNEDPVGFRRDRSGNNYSVKMTPDMGIEEYITACWERHRQEQLGYFRAFLAKFEK